MEVLIIIGILIAICLVWGSIVWINEYSQNVYGYTPFSLGHSLVMSIPIILWIITFLIGIDSTQPTWWDAVQSNLNVILLMIISIGVLIGVFIHMLVHTNVWIALYSTILQLIGVTVIVAVIIFLIGVALSWTPQKRKRRRS